jgi:hypothetical protein
MKKYFCAIYTLLIGLPVFAQLEIRPVAATVKTTISADCFSGTAPLSKDIGDVQRYPQVAELLRQAVAQPKGGNAPWQQGIFNPPPVTIPYGVIKEPWLSAPPPPIILNPPANACTSQHSPEQILELSRMVKKRIDAKDRDKFLKEIPHDCPKREMNHYLRLAIDLSKEGK